MPVWHVSVSVWSRRRVKQNHPALAEREAGLLLCGVGGQREWWFWNPTVHVGHLRVAVTPAEHAQMPPGVAVNDAGETGPERSRTTWR